MSTSPVRRLARRVRLGLARRLDPAAALPRPDPTALVREREDALAGDLLARAGEASGERRWRDAGLLYAEALRLRPEHFGAQVQAGHMFKEAGDLARAEGFYLAAAALEPQDADLALQLGHFYKVAGQLNRSEDAYRRALALQPGWAEPARELARLGERVQPFETGLQAFGDVADDVIGELLPGRPPAVASGVEGVHVLGLGGRPERTRWGARTVLRGVEAMRGFVLSWAPVAEFTISLDGRPVYAAPLDGSVRADGLRKSVFNVWLNLGHEPRGPCLVELAFRLSDGRRLAHREHLVIGEALEEAQAPGSDALVTASATEPLALAAEVNARPSVVRDANRSLLPLPIRAILVMRTDQLGDLVISIPAIRRLRELFPGARLVGLLTSGNADLAAVLGLFDEVVVVDFPDDRQARRRLMTAAAQGALRERLVPYAFDIAIDLAEAGVSRPLMLLSGAKFLYGYYDRDWPFLDAGFEGVTHDVKNYREIAPQSAKTLALVERLGATLNPRAHVLARPSLQRAQLTPYGLGMQDRYVVLHTGARIVFSRWPYYRELAEMLLARTGLKVVIMADDPDFRAALTPALLASDRVVMLDRLLPFDDFDAFLSFCAVFVGNDTGPKHLAALRGARVISLHSSRISWSEWGQELTGSIISRKLPCAGCAVHHDADECGRDFVCIRGIRPEEVFAAVQAELERA